jgi:flavin reductase (DIM6/NTAB) family NADH-FMN oxidoreductase RutF
MNSKAASRPDPTAPLRSALAQFATGVTVITTRAPDGTPVGLTANSFASVSLDPPLVLWSLSLKSASYDAFVQTERYLIHVLGAEQLELAKRFATRGIDKFAGTDWQPTDTELPRLPGCVAVFECASRSRHAEGDHVILVGRVDAFESAGGAPLIFHDSAYISQQTEVPLPQVLRSPWK